MFDVLKYLAMVCSMILQILCSHTGKQVTESQPCLCAAIYFTRCWIQAEIRDFRNVLMSTFLDINE